jgi:arginyl-tRNA synthetase
MSTVAQHLSELVRQAAARAGLDATAVEPVVPTRDPAHGDYQSNAAFRLAKAAGKNPRATVEALRDALPADPAIAKVEVAGAGFLNLHVADAWLAADVAARVAHPHLAPNPKGVGKAVVIDYSSPNVAKRLHVGHLRSTNIGNALDRLHRALGYRVIADNHLGDWGTPIGKLVVAWRAWRDDAAYQADPVGELQRLYQRAEEELEKDPTLLEQARAATVALQTGDPDTVALWRQIVDVSKQELEQVYGRLGIRFDTYHGESFYDPRLASLLDELVAKGHAVESKGALIVPLPDKGLEEQPMLVRKADGAALYGTTDLATIEFRLREYAPEKVLYVVDTRQQHHFRQLFAAARVVGFHGTFVHVWFGMLKYEGGAVASSRKGNVINLVELLDTAARHAYDVVSAKSPHVPEDERRHIAEVVGVGAVKYFDLSQNPQTDIVFSWDRALSLDGGSAVYLQYAYARLCSILRAGGAVDGVPGVLPAHEHPAERTLLRLVSRVPEAIELAADAHKPNLLAEHLEAVAKGIGAFWEHCPVLKDGIPAEQRAARLALVYAASRGIAAGLDCLGIGVTPRL